MKRRSIRRKRKIEQTEKKWRETEGATGRWKREEERKGRWFGTEKGVGVRENNKQAGRRMLRRVRKNVMEKGRRKIR